MSTLKESTSKNDVRSQKVAQGGVRSFPAAVGLNPRRRHPGRDSKVVKQAIGIKGAQVLAYSLAGMQERSVKKLHLLEIKRRNSRGLGRTGNPADSKRNGEAEVQKTNQNKTRHFSFLRKLASRQKRILSPGVSNSKTQAD